MSVTLSNVIRTISAALLVGFLTFGPPAAAQQPSSVNPTAEAVNEAKLLEALKPGSDIRGRASIPDSRAATLIQPGRDWREFNRETLPRVGALAVLGMLAALVLFYFVRGRIRIEAGPSMQRILRFGGLDRFTHWLTATSFILLALTGANVTFGRALLLPVLGPDGFSAWSQFAKYIHNYGGFAFMIGLALTFLIWIKDNIPSGTDVAWFAAGGGLVGKGHPPAKRFNGGQKIVFWSVVVGGFFLSLSGWHLLFPNNEALAEIQWHSTIHGTVAFVMIALMLAHAYIGSVGMEGAFEAMGSGEVDLNWAKEHHSLWVAEEMARKKGGSMGGKSGGMPQPAE